jgi:AbrB family looped-hinge helix DNA binding protein
MATAITVKGQVTLPKAVREAAGIRAGDRVTVRARPEGGVIVEREQTPSDEDAYRRRLKNIAKRRPLRSGPFRDMTTEAIMDLLRGDE